MTTLTAWLSLLVVLQPEASLPEAGGAVAAGPAGTTGCAMNAGLIALMLLVFYFLILRPQQRQQKQHEEMLKSLAKGTMVRTRGGLRGEVVQVKEPDVILLIADRVRVHVLRSHIASVEPAAGEARAESSSSEKSLTEKGANA